MESWLFENPWPLAIALTVVAAILAWQGALRSSRGLLIGGGVALAAAVAAVLIGRAVETPGERAAAVVQGFVAHAERAETDAALALFSSDAVLNYGRRQNPGSPLADIRAALRTLEGKYRIESNRVRRLVFRTLDEESGEVELSCTTAIAGVDSGVPTDWIIRVRKSGDRWLIDRITFERLFAQPPTQGVWR